MDKFSKFTLGLLIAVVLNLIIVLSIRQHVLMEQIQQDSFPTVQEVMGEDQ